LKQQFGCAVAPDKLAATGKGSKLNVTFHNLKQKGDGSSAAQRPRGGLQEALIAIRFRTWR